MKGSRMSEPIFRWAMNSCSCGLVVTAVVALLLLPAQYLVPDITPPSEELVVSGGGGGLSTPAWFDRPLDFPPVDLFITLALMLLGLLTYICEWIQRKMLEKRIVKLNQYLSSSLERLRGWDAEREQLEGTLKLVQNATSEYNLLLYLLLRQHRCTPQACPPSDCIFDKGLGAPLLSVDIEA